MGTNERCFVPDLGFQRKLGTPESYFVPVSKFESSLRDVWAQIGVVLCPFGGFSESWARQRPVSSPFHSLSAV